jgi:rSAM/selenodomain-associated transferase 1
MPLLGAAGAASLHARMIEHTLVTAKSSNVGPVQLYGTDIADAFLSACAKDHGVTLLKQSDGDLGERMRSAFEKAFEDNGCVVLVGTDCPALTVSHLRDAARALSHGHDAVFIPTEDGGYALIGLARIDPRLFSDIAWSTSGVMDETRRRLRELGFGWMELQTLWDVDRPADYVRLIESGFVPGELGPSA